MEREVRREKGKPHNEVRLEDVDGVFSGVSAVIVRRYELEDNVLVAEELLYTEGALIVQLDAGGSRTVRGEVGEDVLIGGKEGPRFAVLDGERQDGVGAVRVNNKYVFVAAAGSMGERPS